MTLIKIRPDWDIPESQVTPESVYLNRRQFLKKMGFTGAGALALMSGCAWGRSEGVEEQLKSAQSQKINAQRNTKFVVDYPITDEIIAASYNNFYEFSYDKDNVWKLVERFQTRPWEVEVTGLVENPRTYDLDDLMKLMPHEERVYRFRCVEAWAMVVPWVGFPMKALIEKVQPKSSAKYVRMLTFFRPDEAPQQQRSGTPWPYFEGLTMEEAMNELTLLVTGIYGHVLPKQHGAPIRLITPWKYGFKSIKSIVTIDFTDRKPRTFWNTLAPREYDFWANVNPGVPHPRWSQATERMIDTGERRPTRLYNGYESYVAHLYKA
ncbi:protein-methionine-sulfoxide reductase catalytic subunit MsrP [Candidatus Poribacteria bacterium]|nr:protein-methionine-sulfoxide reductase catalytic subunit MsrP [Candidatus Poribacteria bacterium]